MNKYLPRRLDKFLSDAHVASRKSIERMWREGRFAVNGIADYPLYKLVDSQRDVVSVDGEPVTLRAPEIYALLNKPAGVLTAMSDPGPKQLVASLLPDAWLGRVGPVGRLDRATTGALLITDDGDLSYLLTHPNHHVWKRYVLTVRGDVAEDDPRLTPLREGVLIGSEKTLPARAGVVPDSVHHDIRKGPMSKLWVEIREGRNRQVRRMASKTGFRLSHLHRASIGPMVLGDVPLGSWRLLSEDEIDALYVASGGRDVPQRRAEEALRRKLEWKCLEARERELVERYFRAQEGEGG